LHASCCSRIVAKAAAPAYDDQAAAAVVREVLGTVRKNIKDLVEVAPLMNAPAQTYTAAAATSAATIANTPGAAVIKASSAAGAAWAAAAVPANVALGDQGDPTVQQLLNKMWRACAPKTPPRKPAHTPVTANIECLKHKTHQPIKKKEEVPKAVGAVRAKGVLVPPPKLRVMGVPVPPREGFGTASIPPKVSKWPEPYVCSIVQRNTKNVMTNIRICCLFFQMGAVHELFARLGARKNEGAQQSVRLREDLPSYFLYFQQNHYFSEILLHIFAFPFKIPIYGTCYPLNRRSR
jgi:hypothetical protein